MSDTTYVDSKSTLKANANILGDGGDIYVWSDQKTESYGSFEARGGILGGDGGFVETSAKELVNFTGMSVNTLSLLGNTGLWLIDPNIVALPTSYDSNTVSTGLASTNMTITSTGNIVFTNAPITWSSTNTLALTASGSITIDGNSAISGVNGVLTVSAGSEISPLANVEVGTFELSSGTWNQSVDENTSLPTFEANDFDITGGTFKRFAGGDGSSGSSYQITDIYGLQGIDSPSNSLLNDHYKLNNHIDASGTANWNSAAGFDPIGSSSNNFTGVLDASDGSGGVYIIDGLHINRSSDNFVGLIAHSDNTPAGFDTVSNLGLENVNITGRDFVGGLAGYSEDSRFDNVYVTGSVTGEDSVGGLIGETSFTTIDNSWTLVDINGVDYVGGLIGQAFHDVYVTQSYALGDVTGTDDYIGGLIGLLVGFNNQIDQTYATGDISGDDSIGGLIGLASDEFTVTNSYALGNVSGDRDIGGFIGAVVFFGLHNGDDISNTYSAGRVTGNSRVGGFAGTFNSFGFGTGDNYWNTETSGLTNAVGVGDDDGMTGITTTNMKAQATFSNWDFTNGSGEWAINEGLSFPYHQHPLTPVVVSGKVYSSTDNSTIAVGASINVDSVSKNLSEITTYADGSYYTLIENGLLSVGEYITSYETTGAVSGQHIFVTNVANGGVDDIDLFKDILDISGSNNVLEHTKVYDLSENSVLLYQGSNNEVVLANDINFLIPTGVTYRFDDDGEVSINGGDITFNGPIEINAGKEGIITQDSALDDTVFNLLGGFGTNTGTLVINGNSGDNNLVLDLDGSTNLPVLIEYHGNSQNNVDPGDILTLRNSGTFSSISYEYTNDNDGTIELVDNLLSTIEYTGLEPIYDNLSVTDRIFTFSNVGQTINLDDDAGIGDDISVVDSTTGEIVYFTSPSNSLTINGGLDDDIIDLDGLDSNFAASLIVRYC